MENQPEESRFNQEFLKGLWKENPVFVAALGLCPALAVTNSLINGLAMGAATFFVLVGASTLVSLLQKYIPKQVRISLFILIIATFVTMVDFILAAMLPQIHKELGAFISLIVVNCLILGRQEAFASKNPFKYAVADGIGMALGFTLALAMIGGIREVLGNGSLLGFPLFGENFEPWLIMILPPGGFFTIGALLMLFTYLKKFSDKKKQSDSDKCSTCGQTCPQGVSMSMLNTGKSLGFFFVFEIPVFILFMVDSQLVCFNRKIVFLVHRTYDNCE